MHHDRENIPPQSLSLGLMVLDAKQSVCMKKPHNGLPVDSSYNPNFDFDLI